jgi:hypothetical protein
MANMVPIIVAILVILLIVYYYTMKKETVDQTNAKNPAPNSAAKETTDLAETPDEAAAPAAPAPKATVPGAAPLALIPTAAPLPPVTPAASVDTARIELYTGKSYTGTKRIIYPGMKQEFAEMLTTKSLVWSYQSMKVVSGTYIMLTNNVGGKDHTGFAVGKYDVPDMFAFIKSYDTIYDHKGLYMDRDYWARSFFIQVLTPSEWNTQRAKKHAGCISMTRAWDYSDTEGKKYCEYALPENNMSNITA